MTISITIIIITTIITITINNSSIFINYFYNFLKYNNNNIMVLWILWIYIFKYSKKNTKSYS